MKAIMIDSKQPKYKISERFNENMLPFYIKLWYQTVFIKNIKSCLSTKKTRNNLIKYPEFQSKVILFIFSLVCPYHIHRLTSQMLVSQPLQLLHCNTGRQSISETHSCTSSQVSRQRLFLSFHCNIHSL